MPMMSALDAACGARHGIALVAASVALALTVASCGGTGSVTEPVERRFALGPDTSRPSTILLASRVDLGRVEARLDAAVQPVIASFSGERDACFETGRFGISISIGCRWHGEVRKRGSLSMSGAGDVLRLSVPAHAWVTGSNRGGFTIEETATADFTVTAVARPALRADWSLDPGLSVDLTWDRRPTLELFGLVDVPVTALVEPKARELLGDLERRLEDEVRALGVRERAEHVWAVLQEPIRLSSDPDVWLRMEPEAVSFSGVDVEGGSLTASLAVEGRLAAVVGEDPPVVNGNRDLPPLGSHATEGPGAFSLVLPTTVRYEVLERELEAALRVGEEWIPNVASGVAVTVEEVDVYPSSPSLAVGLHFTADLREETLDTSGVVYLSGRPVVDSEERVVRVESLDFAAATDNRLVNLAGQIFGEGLGARIQDRLTFDFGADYERLLAAVNEGLNRDLGGGVHIAGDLDFVRVEEVLMLEEHLYVGVTAAGDMEIGY